MQEVKNYIKQSSERATGFVMNLLAKSAFGQQILNQPAEAFIGGFADLVPRTLACYQKDNTKMKQKLLSEYVRDVKQLGKLSVIL